MLPSTGGNSPITLPNITIDTSFSAWDIIWIYNPMIENVDTASYSSSDDFGRVSTNKVKSSQKITIPMDSYITSITCYLLKAASPTDNIQIRIESDNSGTPSWILANTDAYAEKDGSTLTTSPVEYTINFNNPFKISAWTYHIVFTRTWAWDNTNYYKVWIWWTAATAIAFTTLLEWYRYLTSTWQAAVSNTHIYFKLNLTKQSICKIQNTTIKLWYEAFREVLWIVQSSWNAWDSANVKIMNYWNWDTTTSWTNGWYARYVIWANWISYKYWYYISNTKKIILIDNNEMTRLHSDKKTIQWSQAVATPSLIKIIQFGGKWVVKWLRIVPTLSSGAASIKLYVDGVLVAFADNTLSTSTWIYYLTPVTITSSYPYIFLASTSAITPSVNIPFYENVYVEIKNSWASWTDTVTLILDSE